MRKRLLLSLVALVAISATYSMPSPAAEDFEAAGRFLEPFSEDGVYDDAAPASSDQSDDYPTAVSMVALPDGRFVYWNGLENLENAQFPLAADAGRVTKDSRSRLLDLSGMSPQWTVPTPEGGGDEDLFCADQRVLLNGQVLAAGGTRWRNDVAGADSGSGLVGGPGGAVELFGSDAARIYEPSGGGGGGSWTLVDRTDGRQGYMNHGRWYPTLVTLPDGKLFVASGVGRLIYNDKGTNVHETEIFNPWVNGLYDPAHGVWTDNGDAGKTSLPLFARLHLAHNGKIFYPADGQMWGPFGHSYDQALWNVMKFYDPATNEWSDAGIGEFGAVNGAVSILLPFTPDANGDYTTTSVLVAGGTLGTSPGGELATNLTQLITINGDNVTSDRGPDLNNKRWYSSGVMSAIGEVFIFSGADKDEVVVPGIEKPVRQAEVFDPAANGGKGAFKALATAERDRTYHNSAILMADGRILVGGHSPINSLYGPGDREDTGSSNYLHNAAPSEFANNYKDPSFEIFEPPYLFRGPRPEIADVSGIFEWGTIRNVTLNAQTDVNKVQKVMLVRLPATTHVTDADMRAIELPIVEKLNGAVKVKVPSNSAVATPGSYYLFVVSDNGQGPTPSNAAIVRVGSQAMYASIGGSGSSAMPHYKVPKRLARSAGTESVFAGVSGGVGRRASSLPYAIVLGTFALGGIAVGARRRRRRA